MAGPGSSVGNPRCKDQPASGNTLFRVRDFRYTPGMLSKIVPVTLLFAAAVGAQTSPNSITVTASRTNTAPPDQVAFQLSVNSPVTTSRDDVIAALQGSGIGLANFTGVFTTQTYDGKQYSTVLQWNFNLTVPLSSMKATVDLFTGLQMSLSKAGKGLSVSFSISGMQISPQAQQAQPCSLSDLMGDARGQATKIANATGATVGSILALTNAVSDSTAVCSITVKFALGGGF